MLHAWIIKASYQALRQLSWIKCLPWDTGNFSLEALWRESGEREGRERKCKLLEEKGKKKKGGSGGEIKMHSFNN